MPSEETSRPARQRRCLRTALGTSLPFGQALGGSLTGGAKGGILCLGLGNPGRQLASVKTGAFCFVGTCCSIRLPLFPVLREQLSEKKLPPQQKIPRQPIVLGLLILHFFDPGLRELVEQRAGKGEEDGGVGGDDELRAVFDQQVHVAEEDELAAGGEGGFGLVEDVEAFGSETVFDQGEEGLAVRFFMERNAAVGVGDGKPLDFGGDVEKAFGAEEVAGGGAARGLDQAQAAPEAGFGAARRKVEVPRSAFGVEAGGDGEGFDQSGFAAAVLAEEKGDARIEVEGLEMAESRDGEG